jgi:hypothetical protein
MTWLVTTVAVLFLLLNLAHVTVGWVRLRRLLVANPTTNERIADVIQVAWLGIGVCGACMSAVLLALGPAAIAGDYEARAGSFIIALGLIALGVAQFVSTRKHPGLLVISAFGIAVLVALYSS